MRPPSHPRFPCVPDLLIERYLCGELSAEDAHRVEDAAQASPELAAHLRDRQAARSAFAATHPFSTIRTRLAPRPAGALRWQWAYRWALPAFAVCALMVLEVQRWKPPTDEGEQVRVRGGLTARLLVKRGEAVFEQAPGVVLRPGDRVRVEVEDVEGGWLYVLALSDHGRLTPLHGFPQTGGTVRMAPGRLVLPGSLELDAAPEREALVMVLTPTTADAPSAEAVLDWLERAAEGMDFPPRPAPLPSTRYIVRELPKEQP
ncbi:hypothetical protein [Myxococcus sp. SDU36]|uniref:hypothetical protein n=1 Tax=Myxococcus sp. SDU36 TaxID=2831967 RepID=UPI0025431464|nr:hypothetical protein [Myxococcus sp. SDU36]WIG92698.1 hypothetical protein KGD87_18820 [Myxococcus sp. SDU36]